MHDKLSKWIEDERAVSPVIGVILMVAITVILAAVIGTFVLDLGQSAGDSAPQVSIKVADHQDNYDQGTNNALTIEHSGGEKLDFSTITIIIRNANNNTQVGDITAGTVTGFDVSLNGGSTTTDLSSDEFSTGDVLLISGTGFADEEDYTVLVIDQNSGKTIGQSTVEVR